MKVLILSCDTGEGHNSAAAAVAGALTQRGIESHVFDPLVLAGKYAERFVSGAYTTIMKKSAVGVQRALPRRGYLQLDRHHLAGLPRKRPVRRKSARIHRNERV